MELSDKETEYLARQLIKNRTPVTYLSMSRALEIHVDRAKIALDSFYRLHADSLSAAFIVTGIEKDENIMLVKFCQNEQTFDVLKKSRLSSVNTIFVYGLAANCGNDHITSSEEFLRVENTLPVSIDKRQTYYECGMFQPKVDIAKVKEAYTPKTIEFATKGTPRIVADNKKPKESDTADKTVFSSGLKSNYVLRKQRPKSADHGNTIKFGIDLASKRTLEEGEKSKHQYKSRKTQGNSLRERVVMSVDDGIDDFKAKQDCILRPDTAQTLAHTKELEQLFDDDFSALENEEHESEPISIQHVDDVEHVPSGNDKRDETKILSNKATTKDISALDNILSTEKTDPRTLFVPEAEDDEAPQDTVDDDGFITLYRAKPKVSMQAKRAVPAATKSRDSKLIKQTGGKMKQTSLMRFFGK